jgi:hypothetical protein
VILRFPCMSPYRCQRIATFQLDELLTRADAFIVTRALVGAGYFTLEKKSYCSPCFRRAESTATSDTQHAYQLAREAAKEHGGISVWPSKQGDHRAL